VIAASNSKRAYDAAGWESVDFCACFPPPAYPKGNGVNIDAFKKRTVEEIEKI
jgi:hypothetical protein